MDEIHLIPGGIPAQELVDRVMETDERHRGDDVDRSPSRWAVHVDATYWGYLSTAEEGGFVEPLRPSVNARLVWGKSRADLRGAGGNVAATLTMHASSDLVTAVSIRGDTPYSSVRAVLDVLHHLEKNAIVDTILPTDIPEAATGDPSDLADLPF